MKTCVFFGHRDCSDRIRPILEDVILELLKKREAELFLVGTSGAFDRMAESVLRDIERKRGGFEYYIVPAYPDEGAKYDEDKVMYPEGFETFPKRFAVDRRNNYLVSKADVVISYVTKTYGGAAKFTELARKRGKRVIDLQE